MRALIVDDNLINLKVTQKILEKEGLVVHTALSGYACLDLVSHNKYDIIFMDIMMPKMDGIETFHKLRKMEGFCTPVVTLTADDSIGSKEKYLSEGFADYLSKPINIEKIKKIIAEIKIKL